MRILFLALWLASFGVRAMAAETYPRTDLLVEPAELAKPDTARQYVVLDARDKTKYAAGHVSGALWVDHESWSKQFKEEASDAALWSKQIAALGITADTKVLVYDDSMNKEAARIWWILKYWGVADVRLVNGGSVGWSAAKLPLETATPATPKPSAFVAKAAGQRLTTKDQLLASLKAHDDLQIVDARSEGEFCGTDLLKNKRGGAIPGAKHLEWSDLLDHDTQRFKSPEAISKLFADAGIDVQARTAAHCQGGGRAAVMAFALELMGGKSVSNYYRSWGEWGNADDTPIVPGKAK